MRPDKALAPFLVLSTAVLAAVLAAGPAPAQTGAPADTTGAAADITNTVPPTVEFVLERIDGTVQCRNDRPSLPANTPVELRLTNHSGGTAVFDATEFLLVSKNLKSDDSSDAFLGRFGLPEGGSVQIKLRTPARAGEYPFACAEAHEIEEPGPSGKAAEVTTKDGVLVVVATEK